MIEEPSLNDDIIKIQKRYPPLLHKDNKIRSWAQSSVFAEMLQEEKELKLIKEEWKKLYRLLDSVISRIELNLELNIYEEGDEKEDMTQTLNDFRMMYNLIDERIHPRLKKIRNFFSRRKV